MRVASPKAADTPRAECQFGAISMVTQRTGAAAQAGVCAFSLTSRLLRVILVYAPLSRAALSGSADMPGTRLTRLQRRRVGELGPARSALRPGRRSPPIGLPLPFAVHLGAQ